MGRKPAPVSPCELVLRDLERLETAIDETLATVPPPFKGRAEAVLGLLKQWAEGVTVMLAAHEAGRRADGDGKL